MKLQKLWFVGRVHDGSWDLQGVFSSEERAKKACKDRTYWYTDIFLNEELPEETIKKMFYQPDGTSAIGG